MNVEGIVREIDEEIARLNQARGILAGIPTKPHKIGPGRGRPKGSSISAAGRKRISDMMKKRWAERKSGKKISPAKSEVETK